MQTNFLVSPPRTCRLRFQFTIYYCYPAHCFDIFSLTIFRTYIFLQISSHIKESLGGKETMTSFGLFSVNQLSSHAHVSRTNYATALDAQDRLQKLHDPNAFQAAHPSGRLGRILEKQNGANTGDQGMDEAMSAGSLAVDGRPLSEDNLDEGIADAAASTSFVPIQPRQGVVPTITSSMPTMPVAQMSTQGSQPGVVTAPGAPPNPLHGTPQPLLPRYLDHSAQNLLYGSPLYFIIPSTGK